MVRGIGKHTSLFDVAKATLNAEVSDLNHGLMFLPEAQLDGSDDIEVLKGVHAVVITAGAKQKPERTRIDLAETNPGICRKLIPNVVAPDAILSMVTIPVDVLTYVAQKIGGLREPAGPWKRHKYEKARVSAFSWRNIAGLPFTTPAVPLLPAAAELEHFCTLSVKKIVAAFERTMEH
jgi:hypothetical protein